MKYTHSVTPAEIEQKWHLVDAEGLVVGRLAANIARILRGKHKTSYTPHMDCGDVVVVINADKVVFTGNKMKDKKYYWHTGYAGGIKERTPEKILGGRFPERVLVKAVERMIPEGPLGTKQMTHLKVYAGAEHPHSAQAPVPLDIGSRNSKNKRSV